MFTKLVRVCLFVIIYSFCSESKVPFQHEDISKSGESELEQRELDGNLLRNLLNPYLNSILDNVDLESMRNARNLQVSYHCLGHMTEWITQLRSWSITDMSVPDLWAIQMVDAFGKVPEGILSGHVNSFGDFDECTGVRANGVLFSNSTLTQFPDLSRTFRGQYCTTYLIPMLGGASKREDSHSAVLSNEMRESLSIPGLLEFMSELEGVIRIAPTIGTCYPSSCSVAETVNITNYILSELNLDSVLGVRVPYCTTGEKEDLDNGDISIIAFLGVLVGFCLFAGFLDMYLNPEGQKPKYRGALVQYILAFSFYTNIRKWASTGGGGGDDFGCVHGIRVLSTAWVVLGHTWLMVVYMPSWNMVDLANSQLDWTLLTTVNATVAVDTFFVMSGMLVAFNLLKLLDKSKGKLNLPMFYIHRILRITPTYAILVWILATLFPYFGSGPFWFFTEGFTQNCEKNWWVNLLYVNNFVNVNERCQTESWYLANDMQFYILSPLIIYPIYRWAKFGLGALVLATLGSIAAPMVYLYNMDEVIPTTISTRRVGTWQEDFYIKPYFRVQTYLVGIWLGYILYKYRGKKVQIPRLLNLLGWTLSTGICLGVLYGIAPWYDLTVEMPQFLGSFYGGFHRVAWGVGVSWVIFACVKGYGGLVNDFLSWSPFAPLGRVCFCVYLLSKHFQFTFHFNLKQTITYDNYTMANIFLAHLFISFLVGWACTITMESPFIVLEKLIFDGPTKPTIKKDDERLPQKERYGIYYQKQELDIVMEGDLKTNSKV